MMNSSVKRLKSRLKGKSERQAVALAGRVSMATLVAVDAYAKENTITRSRAVRQLIEIALKRRRSACIR
jgi:hypothetical protein